MINLIHKIQWHGHAVIEAVAIGVDNLLDFVAEGLAKGMGE